ncbi:MAG: glycosyl transferase [Candidatus Levybacteria bacterium RIFCSPHIGHO2_02_FULL_40_18]|nr:MAG: glycosyl transferase [Candidatus Levybacteria bacterium RIFCSPHIGHO2_01_FULL_40_58]OGH27310.1 MAG: glycosyl transferase [Candidatus Levybacteria bacterium RIFCSPHIGHO2_02_FULL_40_18]OGH30923.1 MAG: glycosyl transferase [Candidatus Levybacteria bacterium RIFCSPHIGHO2_12_FULL_40_31]OGH40934.1 MAG: glycosyl transferase [Candidatus Levybacteria bacterium RIFCSPLOWO2_01_FULL_40_64]OGH48989.1 MAG: glycosyl transferase [Candidatus Levybacteria bacterium RIFCSPLOWO2_02_FULL_41_11]OGH53730.1 MA
MQLDFSIVVPVFNEEESLRELVRNIEKAFSSIKKTYEVIFVDDGSTDKTLDVLKRMVSESKKIRFLSFRKNLGKSAALTLGFREANGKYIVTLDADLQDDPSNIKNLYRTLEHGKFDLVTGWRKNRQDGFLKILSSKIFNKVVVPTLFGIRLNDLNSGLKIYRSEAAKDLKIYGGMHRFIPVIAAELGFSVSEKEVLHHPRKYGESKYKFSKIFTDIPDLLTIYFIMKYNRRPLHFFGKIGGAIFGAGFAILLYLSYLRIFLDQKIGDRPLLLFGVLLVIAGIQTLFTGLLADLIVNANSKKGDEFSIKYDSREGISSKT